MGVGIVENRSRKRNTGEAGAYFSGSAEVGMKTLKTAVIIGLALGMAGVSGAAEIAENERSSLVPATSYFSPGPPIWHPPERRVKAAAIADTLEQAVDQCVGDAMAAIDAPGATVAVIVDGELVYKQGYGIKRRGGSDPVDADTRFRIGSVTKMLTAAAVMQQVDAGTVFLDDKITTFIPEVDFLGHWPAEAMTVEHLLTHSTGVPDLLFYPDEYVGPDALTLWAESLYGIGLHAPPGAFYNYSNPNFNLAGLVVERASGLEFRSYMDERVFGPAGMSHTTFDPNEVVASGNASHGHMDNGSGGEIRYAPDEYDNGAYAPAGYAFSTAEDLARWALLLADGGGEVLSRDSAILMQAFHRDLDSIPGVGYGYGVFVEPFYDLTVRQHGGNIWGWGSYLLWHPQQRFAVAVLSNEFQGLPDAAYCVADYVLEPDHSAEPVYPADPERVQLIAGTYDVTVGTGWNYSPYPVLGEVTPQGDNIFLHLWDPVSGWTALWILDHVMLDTYNIDADLDGTVDLQVDFIIGAGPPEQTRWMRMRPVVGTPQLVPRQGRRLVP
jgi:CubicO group peptidase (beta-lactamase class C family)